MKREIKNRFFESQNSQGSLLETLGDEISFSTDYYYKKGFKDEERVKIVTYIMDEANGLTYIYTFFCVIKNNLARKYIIIYNYLKN